MFHAMSIASTHFDDGAPRGNLRPIMIEEIGAEPLPTQAGTTR